MHKPKSGSLGKGYMIPTRSLTKNSKKPPKQTKNTKQKEPLHRKKKSASHTTKKKLQRRSKSLHELILFEFRKPFSKGGERGRRLQIFYVQLTRSSKLPPFVPPLQLLASHICIVTFTFSLLRQQKRQFSSKDQSETPSGSQSVNQRNSKLLHIHKPRHNWSQKRNAKLNTCFTTFLPAF